MSKTIEEIRAIVATDQGYDSWEVFLEWEDADDVAYHLAIEYSNQQTQELQEQNAELAKELAHVVKALKTVSSFGATTPIIEHAEGILTKYNHLNKKP